MRFLYTFFIRIYGFSIRLASPFNTKAGEWIDGRRNWVSQLKGLQEKFTNSEVKWFHFASLGEFEQGRPIMEKLKAENPNFFLLITFFSPSGYKVRKSYEQADFVCYLPLDTRSNAKTFLNIAQPNQVFFIKYEFWYNFLQVLGKNKIETYLISGIFRRNQHFFKWYGWWFRNQLAVFEHFFLQNERSVELLTNIGYDNATYSGDTRFDRVLDIASKPKKLPEIERLLDDRKVFVIGSNWPEDDELLLPFMQKNSSTFLFIIAPHNISERQLSNLESKVNLKTLRLSGASLIDKVVVDIILIDSIGFLSSIFQYGQFAYIGGGFGKNVHNVLEAAVYGIPCIFGPNYHKFQECHDLIALKGAFVINSSEDLNAIITQLSLGKEAEKAGAMAKEYVLTNSGATTKILSYLQSNG